MSEKSGPGNIPERESLRLCAAVIAAGQTVTYDLGGSAGTSEMADAIIENITRAG